MTRRPSRPRSRSVVPRLTRDERNLLATYRWLHPTYRNFLLYMAATTAGLERVFDPRPLAAGVLTMENGKAVKR